MNSSGTCGDVHCVLWFNFYFKLKEQKLTKIYNLIRASGNLSCLYKVAVGKTYQLMIQHIKVLTAEH